ncbi:LEA14-like dessication related protein [Halopseudomonas xinjiangensis]|uniref:LEA14-like dessication related protein n=1 Tax=Halopseudomonas xinjiangensis TaxID=487184 RepID=A0A1H1UVZ0_9GAMM|nr:LEA type 2 family protein [Halopseudomonas xinjiangensis]SDS76672.1 LEA14-like dessication related protein [Halopseudomonas xinjiangensis]
MFVRQLSMWLMLLGMSSLSGCAALGLGPSYTKPEIALANVEMLKSNLWEQSFQLRLRVDNPNDRVLPIRGMHYVVYLNDTKLATGVSDSTFDVPAYGSEYFHLNVRSNLWRHLGDLAKMVERQQAVDYRLEGHIRTGFFLSPKINLKEEGSLDPSEMRF